MLTTFFQIKFTHQVIISRNDFKIVKMSNNQLNTIINKVFKKATVVNSFLDENHIEFILIKENKEHRLVWLPSSLGTCVLFTLPMKAETFINEFTLLPQQNRLTYIINKFIEHSFTDLDNKSSQHLQTLINKRNGVHQTRFN